MGKGAVGVVPEFGLVTIYSGPNSPGSRGIQFRPSPTAPSRRLLRIREFTCGTLQRGSVSDLLRRGLFSVP